MGITNKFKRTPLSQIQINRDERQRREIDVEDLLASIKARGVIQPIVVETIPGSDKLLLVAGERRYTASMQLGLKDIPTRLAEDLTETERQIIELEENVKRHDLPWKDEINAVARIHALYSAIEPGWTQEKTSESIGIAAGSISIMLRVAEELKSGQYPQIAEAPGWRPAYNIIMRKDGRLMDDAMNDLMDTASEEQPVAINTAQVDPKAFAAAKPGQLVPIKGDPRTAIQPIQRVESILNTDFCQWSQTYNGPLFSFIHCDFPYGIDIDKSEQANTSAHGTYDDSESTYWKLCECLAHNLDRLMTQSGHLMFWFSMEHYHATLTFFKRRAASLEFQHIPLIWTKTDNKGILSDPKRRPRHIYETAFIASRGDRFTVKSVSDSYGAPTSKEIHHSEKPEPMLRHFFQMFVDENTRMLDPTCGSGTSLRAAESLGATSVLGLELNSDFVDAARIALRKSRNLRSATKAKS